MQFERIKKNHKKKIIIGGLILVCITSAITITTTRAKYKLIQDIPLVRGNINYKSYDFKVMAMYQSEDKVNYTEINSMPTSGYAINEERTYCITDNKTQVKGKIKTVNGIHGLYNITKNDKCYLYFDKYIPPITIDNIIAGLTINSGTPNFSQIATTDEGVYKASDPMYSGYSYYWRGATTNNYVKFANKCWRIVRINGDKTMRLIYDGSSCHANGTSTTDSIAVQYVAYNVSKEQSNYVGWTYSGTSQRTLSGTPSNAKTQLESWYNNNITGTNASKVADGKFCNDRNIGKNSSGNQGTWSATGNTFYYAGYRRLYYDYAPTLACNSGDVYTLKVGLIIADEVEFAGGEDANNTSYYLYNRQVYWTMSPYNWSSSSARAFSVNDSGRLSYNYVSDAPGLRPVINLKADTLFQTGGNGTLNNPYVVI